MADRAGRPRVFPRILLFAGMTAAVIAATAQEVPGIALGAVGIAWVGALFALVHATQARDQSSQDSGTTGGDGAVADGDGDGGGGDGGGGE